MDVSHPDAALVIRCLPQQALVVLEVVEPADRLGRQRVDPLCQLDTSAACYGKLRFE